MNLLEIIREWRGLRDCFSVLQLGEYAATKLRTPTKIAFWLTKLRYEDEKPCVWRSAEDVLSRRDENGWQYGNCSERAVVALAAMQYLPEYEAQILCIYGSDEHGEKQGHAVCAFQNKKGKGFIDGSECHTYPISVNWSNIAINMIRPLWLATRYEWVNEQGRKVPGVL